MNLEEVRARIEDAMGVKGEDWWLDEAVRMIECYRSVVEHRRVYDVSTVGARLRTAREIVGLTLCAQAERVGLLHQELSRIERGKRDCPAEVFARLCLSLRVTEAWVLGDSDEGGPPMPGGILRKQKYQSHQYRSKIRQKKLRAQAEIERLRGLRPPKPEMPLPKRHRDRPAPAPSMPRTEPCPRCSEPLSSGYCIADGCGYPGASWTPSWMKAATPGQEQGTTPTAGQPDVSAEAGACQEEGVPVGA